MSRKNYLESPPAARRQPLLTSAAASSAKAVHCADASRVRSRRSRMGETAGGCAAVCCCCPCSMVHLLILAVYRLPRLLWKRKKRRRLLRRKKRRISAEEAGDLSKLKAFGFDCGDEIEESTEDEDRGEENDVVDWDCEMWDRFNGAGFWRSASQRSEE